MQTFLPYEHLGNTCYVLDRQRLGKQRVECKQILNALVNGGGWANHPCTNMWQGYEEALIRYSIEICNEWRRRGYVDSLLSHFESLRGTFGPYVKPEWMGDPRLHTTHQSNLLRKFPEHYSRFSWSVPDNLEYYWPSL